MGFGGIFCLTVGFDTEVFGDDAAWASLDGIGDGFSKRGGWIDCFTITVICWGFDRV